MRTKTLACFLAVALPLTYACKPTEQAEGDDPSDTAVQATPAELPGADAPSDLSPVGAQTMIDDVTIGHKVTDGIISPEDQGDDFAPGDPVHLTMKVGDAPAGSEVKVIWYGPGEAKIGEDAKPVTAGGTTLAFQAPDTSSWQKGDYRAEIWIGDEKVNQQTFNLTDKSGAGR
jgi:hypothetical protein